MKSLNKNDENVDVIEVPIEEIEATDISPQNVERMARGYIMGTQSIARRREVREELEERVVKRIGKKGKWLTDKLFELIEGVYVVDKRGGKDGSSIRYYQVPPNLNAIIYALDRVLGKPKQHTEISEEKKGIILVEHVIKNLAGDPYGQNGARKNVGREPVADGVGTSASAGRTGTEELIDTGAGSGAVS